MLYATTAAQKLKIKEGYTLLTLHAPVNFKEGLEPLPGGVKITDTRKKYEQVHWFVSNRETIEKLGKEWKNPRNL